MRNQLLSAMKLVLMSVRALYPASPGLLGRRSVAVRMRQRSQPYAIATTCCTHVNIQITHVNIQITHVNIQATQVNMQTSHVNIQPTHVNYVWCEHANNWTKTMNNQVKQPKQEIDEQALDPNGSSSVNLNFKLCQIKSKNLNSKMIDWPETDGRVAGAWNGIVVSCWKLE